MSIRTPLLALAALAVLAPSAHAVSILNDTFNTGYSNGDLIGQNGYDVDGDATFNFSSTAGVGGTGGVTSDTNDQFDGGFAYRTLNYGVTAANPILNVSVDVASKGFATGAGGTTTSYFGVSIFNSAFASLGEIYFRFATGTTTQAVVAFAGSGASTLTTINSTGGLNTFKTLGISINTATNTESFLLNGVVIGTAAYTTADATIADVDLTTGPAGYDIGAFDNLKLDAVAPVPEPTTLAALGLGAVAMLRRRKRA